MSVTKAVILGKDFKQLIANVTFFPSTGSFAGADLINLSVSDGLVIATAFGVVLSRSRVKGDGILPLIAVDAKQLIGYSKIVRPNAKVLILSNDKIVKLKAGRSEMTVSYQAGTLHKFPNLDSTQFFSITSNLAPKLRYLGDIAYPDTSKPELNCVLMTPDKRLVAVNQKTIGVLTHRIAWTERLALPIPLALNVKENDKLFITKKEIVIKRQGDESGNYSIYAMPLPSKAQKEFPLDSVDTFQKQVKTEIASVEGKMLADALVNCDVCLGSVSKTDIETRLVFEADIGMTLTAENGGAKFKCITKSDIKAGGVVVLPMAEIIHVVELLGSKPKVTISVDKAKSTVMSFDDGWLLFPPWKDKA